MGPLSHDDAAAGHPDKYPEFMSREISSALNLPLWAELVASRILVSLLKFLFEWYWLPKYKALSCAIKSWDKCKDPLHLS